jgi:regulator of replication initiation timing
MSKNTRNFRKRDDDKQDTINKLKAQIKNLMKENRILRSENKTLQAAWEKTKGYLQELHEDVPLEKALEYKTYPKEPDKLPEAEKVKAKEAEREVARQKWKNWNKGKK